MKLLFSPTFLRASKRQFKEDLKLAESVNAILRILETDMFHPMLKTHKLRGSQEGRWSCTVAYDMRIVFKVVKIVDAEAILLLKIGRHNDVY